VSFNAGFSHPVMSVANACFIRKRGLAFAISLSSFSLGGIIFAPLLSTLVTQHGWRSTVIISAGVLWAVVLPLSLKLVRSPESMGLRPDGDTDATVGARRNVTTSGHDFTLRQALREPTFWWLALSTTLRLAVINTMNVHFIPILVWKGLSEIEAAFTLSAMATMSLTARLTMGVVGDRFPKQRVIAVFMLLGIAGLLMLQQATETGKIAFYILTYATMEGIIPLNWALIGDFFGRSHFATLRGVMGLVYTWGAVVFPVLAGWIFDTTQSYALVIWILIGLFAAGSLGFALLKPPRPPVSAPSLPAHV
ncbi:MAG: MFS transporter, partial [Chloroflexota bacterium]